MSNNLNPFEGGNSSGKSSIFGSFRNKIGRSKSNASSTKGFPSSPISQKGSSPFDSTSGSAPPPYSPVVNNPSSSAPQSFSLNRAPTTRVPVSSDFLSQFGDNDLSHLANFDTVLLIDDSGSMQISDFGQPSRWKQTELAIKQIAPIFTKYDSDGIDLYFMNVKNHGDEGDALNGVASGGWHHITDANTVEAALDFQPGGITPTGKRIDFILRPYLDLVKREVAKYRDVKPLNLIVITDGVPTDDVEEVIKRIAKKLDDMDAPLNQLGIQFFQVGNEASAREHLRVLDDDIKKRGVRDMVDTVTWDNNNQSRATLSGETLIKVALGGVVRKFDKKKSRGS